MISSGSASAVCNVAGKVGTVWAYNNTNMYVGINPESTYGTNYVVYFQVPTTTSAAQLLLSAAASDEYVYVSGNATACPTTGSIRYGGVATYAFSSDHQ
jgi:hypothetical protein